MVSFQASTKNTKLVQSKFCEFGVQFENALDFLVDAYGKPQICGEGVKNERIERRPSAIFDGDGIRREWQSVRSLVKDRHAILFDLLKKQWANERLKKVAQSKDATHVSTKEPVPADVTMQMLLQDFLEVTQGPAKVYPNMRILAQVSLTLPVSNAESERAFSSLNLIKTDLRNRMSDEMLGALMRIQRLGPDDIREVPFTEIVMRWYKQGPRRVTWKLDISRFATDPTK